MSQESGKQTAYNRKFNVMLRVMAAPDGGEWTGTKMQRATGGEVQTSYFSSLRDGHISIPRADKLDAISKAMGFPPHLWFKSVDWWEDLYDRWSRGEHLEEALDKEHGEASEGDHLAALLDGLFEARRREDGEPMTDAEAAAQSGGALSAEDVRALREGTMQDPSWTQILALCDIFEVDPSYWSRRRIAWRPSPGLARTAEDQESYVIFQNSLKLSEHDRGMLRTLSDHLRREQRKRERGKD
jgi:hypothetical protein